MPNEPAPAHPVRLVIADDLRRSRATVLLRALLVVPHVLSGAVYTAAAAVTAVAAWVVALASGRTPVNLHSFLARYLRWSTHAAAYAALLADPYPRFDGGAGYPIDIEIDAPTRQRRWETLGRPLLAIPAAAFGWALAVVLLVVTVAGWFAALATGRMPRGLRNLGAYCLRYSQQTAAYLLLLTDRYPTLASAEIRREQSV